MSRVAVVVAVVVGVLAPLGTAPSAQAAAETLTDDVAAVAVANNRSGVVDVAAPVSDDRVFIVQREGRIFILEDGVVDPTPFLDIRNRVDDGGGEQGLLGLAFPVDYPQTGEFYVNYTAEPDGRTRVSQFDVSGIDPDVADAGSEDILVSVAQPASNHNGGDLQFDADGYLLVALGDGGGGGDTFGNGQNKNTILGTILRIQR